MPKIKNKVQLPESKLLKAMAELESAIEKGDELEDQDPEGGLSTEGDPLSNAAPSGKASRTKKSRGGSSSSSSDDASSVSKADDASSIEKMMSASDDESSAEPPKKKGKKVAKAAASSSSSSGDDDSSSDDQSDDDDRPAEKSVGAALTQGETVAKAIEVSEFLEGFVDNIGVAFARMAKSFTKELQAAEARLNARIDNRVAKSIGTQHSFNTRLAQAVSAIGETVQGDVVDMIKSLANSPAPTTRGKAVLSKGEVNQPPWSGSQAGDNRMANGSEAGDFVAELGELSTDAIGDWLFKKSATNTIDPKLILAWEADRYNVEALPVQVRKALVNDLCK